MSGPLPALSRNPDARVERVEEMLRKVLAGDIRIPIFQRGLKWDAQQVLDLMDSVYRGLPIGSLLLFTRDAPAASISFGPLRIDAPKTSNAWWVVDGQQRLTSLTVALSRPTPLPEGKTDPFVVYFDAENDAFRAPPKEEAIPNSWIELPRLSDPTSLGQWLLDWPNRRNRELTRRVLAASTRIREYRLPLYIVETDDEQVLREIFFRVNNTGKRMEWSEVHDALYGHHGAAPSTIAGLAAELAAIGMGRVSENELTTCLLAFRGLDPTRTIVEHRQRGEEALQGAAAEALPALQQALVFLRKRAGIPHLRLLPRLFVLEVLTRFFALHPEPTRRTQELLSRWLWRALIAEGGLDERTLVRRSVAAVKADDEEGSLQELLDLVPRERQIVTLPESFDARAAASRLALVGLASLKPRSIDRGLPIDVAQLIEAEDVRAFKAIVPAGGGPENRALHPGSGSLRSELLSRIADHGVGDSVLASHGVSPAAARDLAGNPTVFLAKRRETLTNVLQATADRMAGWLRKDRDRPSIDYVSRPRKSKAP